MWETLRAAVLALAMIALGALAAVASAASQAGVAPAPGHRTTRFSISFRTQMATGNFSGVRRTDVVSVTGPQRGGCVASRSLDAGAQPAETLVRVQLGPGSGHRWCTGLFRGEVVQSQSVICGPPQMIVCPQLVLAPQTIATFSLRVR
ncbi:MAG: hypothetical protein WCB67_18925 [Solirubrobacteraceae bacterium]